MATIIVHMYVHCHHMTHDQGRMGHSHAWTIVIIVLICGHGRLPKLTKEAIYLATKYIRVYVAFKMELVIEQSPRVLTIQSTTIPLGAFGCCAKHASP